jgi:hypothetical protein
MKCSVHKDGNRPPEGLFSYTVQCFWCGAEEGGETMSPREALDQECTNCGRKGSYFVNLDRFVGAKWLAVRF